MNAKLIKHILISCIVLNAVFFIIGVSSGIAPTALAFNLIAMAFCLIVYTLMLSKEPNESKRPNVTITMFKDFTRVISHKTTEHQIVQAFLAFGNSIKKQNPLLYKHILAELNSEEGCASDLITDLMRFLKEEDLKHARHTPQSTDEN